jgi:hypothetical protein
MNQFRIIQAVSCVRFKKMRRHADELTQALGDDHDLAVLLDKLRAYRVQDAGLVEGIAKRRNATEASVLCGKRTLHALQGISRR